MGTLEPGAALEVVDEGVRVADRVGLRRRVGLAPDEAPQVGRAEGGRVVRGRDRAGHEVDLRAVVEDVVALEGRERVVRGLAAPGRGDAVVLGGARVEELEVGRDVVRRGARGQLAGAGEQVEAPDARRAGRVEELLLGEVVHLLGGEDVRDGVERDLEALRGRAGLALDADGDKGLAVQPPLPDPEAQDVGEEAVHGALDLLRGEAAPVEGGLELEVEDRVAQHPGQGQLVDAHHLGAADPLGPRVGLRDEGRLGRDGRLAEEGGHLAHGVERAAEDVEGGRVRGDHGLSALVRAHIVGLNEHGMVQPPLGPVRLVRLDGVRLAERAHEAPGLVRGQVLSERRVRVAHAPCRVLHRGEEAGAGGAVRERPGRRGEERDEAGVDTHWRGFSEFGTGCVSFVLFVRAGNFFYFPTVSASSFFFPCV